MKSKINSENIIVAIIMVVIILFSVVVIGVEPIKEWLSKPLTWDEPDYLEVSLAHVHKESKLNDTDLVLSFAIVNLSENVIKDFDFIMIVDQVEMEVDSTNCGNIESFNGIGITETVTKKPNGHKNVISEETYNKLLNSDINDIEFSYKTVSLYDGDKYLINNNGVFKTILIVIISAVLGALGIFWAKEKWLRILLKVCGLPAVLIIILVALIVLIGSRSGGGQGEMSGAFKSAQERYKNAASHKAGHLQHGNTAEAAKAQAQMDSAMADMIGSSSNNSNFRSAQERYKRAAAHKAGHLQHGNTADAARAQAEMDRAMADMIKYK